MKTFLIVIAGVFVAFVLFVVVAIVALRFFLMSKLAKFRDAIEQLTQQMGMAEIPPFAMSLKPLRGGEWANDRVAEISGDLQERGFESAGDFQATPFPADLKVRLLTNVDQGMQAAIYEHPVAGVWLEVVTRYGDGRVVCDSSCRDHLMDSMPQKTIRFHEGAGGAEVVDAHLAARPTGDWRRIAPQDLPALFEAIYAEEMEWRGSRGGPTAEEIGRITERDGKPATPDVVDLIRQQWQTQFHAHRITGLREALRDSGTVGAGEWERISERLLFVYDGMPVSQVGEAVDSLRELFEENDEDAGADDDLHEEEDARRATELADKVESAGARRAFADVTRMWIGKRGFVLFRTVDDPIPADAYVQPAWDDAEDEGRHLE